jgi:hypothetical protein
VCDPYPADSRRHLTCEAPTLCTPALGPPRPKQRARARLSTRRARTTLNPRFARSPDHRNRLPRDRAPPFACLRPPAICKHPGNARFDCCDCANSQNFGSKSRHPKRRAGFSRRSSTRIPIYPVSRHLWGLSTRQRCDHLFEAGHSQGHPDFSVVRRSASNDRRSIAVPPAEGQTEE